MCTSNTIENMSSTTTFTNILYTLYFQVFSKRLNFKNYFIKGHFENLLPKIQLEKQNIADLADVNN